MKPGDIVEWKSFMGTKRGKVIDYFTDNQPVKETVTFKCEETDRLYYCSALDLVVVCEGEPAEIVKQVQQEHGKRPAHAENLENNSDETF
jgi:hypothetical protein